MIGNRGFMVVFIAMWNMTGNRHSVKYQERHDMWHCWKSWLNLLLVVNTRFWLFFIFFSSQLDHLALTTQAQSTKNKVFILITFLRSVMSMKTCHSDCVLTLKVRALSKDCNRRTLCIWLYRLEFLAGKWCEMPILLVKAVSQWRKTRRQLYTVDLLFKNTLVEKKDSWLFVHVFLRQTVCTLGKNII